MFFAQTHEPGRLAESDFTHMSELGVTIAGEAFDHLVYHFVLTYSNWEAGTVCFSESFASLREGLHNALWELGGVPRRHRTDRLTAAVNVSTVEEENILIAIDDDGVHDDENDPRGADYRATIAAYDPEGEATGRSSG